MKGGAGLRVAGLASTPVTASARDDTALTRKPRLGLGGEVEAVELPSAHGHQPRLEALAPGRFKHRAHRPVFAGAERLDLHLAVDDDPERDRLHAAGGFRAGQLAPQDRREREAHLKVIQRAAGEVGPRPSSMSTSRGSAMARVTASLVIAFEGHAADGRVLL